MQEYLSGNSLLAILNLCGVKIHLRGIKCLSKAFDMGCNIESLNVSYNQLGPDCCKYIKNIMVKGRSLTSLDISENPLKDEGIINIEDSFEYNDQGSKLLSLNVAGTEISSEGIFSLF